MKANCTTNSLIHETYSLRCRYSQRVVGNGISYQVAAEGNRVRSKLTNYLKVKRIRARAYSPGNFIYSTAVAPDSREKCSSHYCWEGSDDRCYDLAYQVSPKILLLIKDKFDGYRNLTWTRLVQWHDNVKNNGCTLEYYKCKHGENV